MAMTRIRLLGALALAITVTSCSHHGTDKAAATTASSTAATVATTSARPAPVTGPLLPPFFPSAAVGANCQYPPTQDQAL